MIERAGELGASQVAPLVVGDTSQMSAGDMLREAREASGLHIEVVAAALKVSTQKLEALENDDIAALPDPVFARALAASVCRVFKIDPVPVLEKLPGSPRAGLADADQTIGASFRSGALRAGRGSGVGWYPSRLLTAVVVLLLLGTAAIFWLPQSTFEQLNASITRITARGDAAIGTPAETDGSAATQEPGTVVELVASSAQPVATAVTGADTAPPPVAVAQDDAPATASVEGKDVLVLVARADSWITVLDASDKKLLHRKVIAGETVGLSGTLPLSVVVGRAAGIDVLVRGKVFDLASVTKGSGVARFEVKS